MSTHFPSLRLVLLALAVAILICAPVLVARAPSAKPAPDYVHGVVLDDRGNAVPGAIVSGVAMTKGGPGPVISALFQIEERATDAHGRFDLVGYPAAPNVVIRIRARKDNSFTSCAVDIPGDVFGKAVTLHISPANARSICLRAVDDQGQPVAGASIAARHRGTAPAPYQAFPAPVITTGGKPWVSGPDGRLQTSGCLDPDGSYRVEVRAEGLLSLATAWKVMPGSGVLDFGDLVLRRGLPVNGRVVDRQGQAVAGARIVRGDDRQRIETRTGADGRFQLHAAPVGPGFLTVEKSGFRFHGQSCDGPGTVTITLARSDEPPVLRMTTLPPELSRDQRRSLAARVAAPLAQERLQKPKGDDRVSGLLLLARFDPARVLAELEKQPLPKEWHDGLVRRAVAQAIRAESFEEARAVVGSIKDPGFSAIGYLDLAKALPIADTAARRGLLDQALVHARAVAKGDHRIVDVAKIARALWISGDKDRAAQLLRECQPIARQLPTVAWGGYARGAFAEDLALIDLPAALDLMRDLTDGREYARHHGNLAVKLAAIRPVEAEQVLAKITLPDDRSRDYQYGHYSVSVCSRMAAVDLTRAARIADAVKNPIDRAQAYGAMSESLADSHKAQARKLLDQAFGVLASAAAPQSDGTSTGMAAIVAGGLLPAAEKIDPALTAEYFWRARSFRVGPFPFAATDQIERCRRSAVRLALMLGRYQRQVSLGLLPTASAHGTPSPLETDMHLLAYAIADPRQDVALVERLPDGGLTDLFRETLAKVLTDDPPALERRVRAEAGVSQADEDDL